MMKIIRLSTLTIFLTLIAGCNKTPEAYFENNQTGSSVDYGVFKWGQDHVITVHGFEDDEKVCLDIAKMLESQGGSYSCGALN